MFFVYVKILHKATLCFNKDKKPSIEDIMFLVQTFLLDNVKIQGRVGLTLYIDIQNKQVLQCRKNATAPV